MSAKYTGPFPDFYRPSEAEFRAVVEALATIHGFPEPKSPLEGTEGEDCCTTNWSVLDSLVRTLLSQNTTDKTSIRAFNSLKEQFPTYEGVLKAEDSAVEESIRVGGLAAIKTKRIKHILQTLDDSSGKCCLEHLRDMPTEDIKTYLGQFPGIGPKTMSCVLMFALDRQEFPVDVHVHRITKQLGWCPKHSSREQSYLHLNCLVPDDLKYALHVQLVEHGKVCSSCSGKPSKKSEGVCPIKEFKNRRGAAAGKVTEVKTEDGDVGVGVEVKTESKKRKTVEVKEEAE